MLSLPLINVLGILGSFRARKGGQVGGQVGSTSCGKSSMVKADNRYPRATPIVVVAACTLL